MNKYKLLLPLFLMLANAQATLQANLIDRGNGLIYDTALNVTWLQNMNPAGCAMNWYDAKAWANDFVYAGLDDWRLPSLPYGFTIPGTSYGSWGGELGYLYYVTLGNPAYNPYVRVENINLGPFVNSPFATSYSRGVFWLDAEPFNAALGSTWIFNFDSRAGTDSSSIFGSWFVWPVRDGDVACNVPDTGSTLLLLGLALTSLAGVAQALPKGSS